MLSIRESGLVAALEDAIRLLISTRQVAKTS
jgi:hypothetical protein